MNEEFNLFDVKDPMVTPALKEYFALDGVRNLPLLKSLKRTIDDVYLPKGYTSRLWENPQTFDIHVKITNEFNNNQEFFIGDVSMVDFHNNGFIKKGVCYYQNFPIIKDMINNVISVLNHTTNKRPPI